MIIERAHQLAQRSSARVVFPGALDVRVLKVANCLHRHGLAHPILVASPFALRQLALSCQMAMGGIQITDPQSNQLMRGEFALHWLTRAGDKTPVDALEKLNDPLMFTATMVSVSKADVRIAGNLPSTANVLCVGLRIIGLQPDCKTLPPAFLMLSQYLESSLGFADCSVVLQPTTVQLVDVAIASVQIWQTIAGEEPRAAILSFLNKDSARHPNVANVQQVIEIVCEHVPRLTADGELQLNVTFVPNVAVQKAPTSLLKGSANVMVLPSLEAGNVGYKITQHLGGYRTVGPLIQGLVAPLHDLSRGCNVREIIRLASMVAVPHQTNVGRENASQTLII